MSAVTGYMASPPLPVARRATLPPVGVSLAVGALLLVLSWGIVTIDVSMFLVPWFDHIAATGPIAAFAVPFSDYTPPYLYLLAAGSLLDRIVPTVTIVKLISVGGTVALALAVRHLLIRIGAPDPDRGAALMFAWPSVAINAGLLGQCDAMWAAPCVMALAAAADRRHAAMLAWCGLALAFKAQAVLVAPFFLALLIARRVPLRLWPIAPLVTAAMMLPAWAAGWPAADLATIYLRQTSTYQSLAMNAPNIWMIAQGLPLLGTLPLTGLAIAAATGASAAYVACFSIRRLEGAALVPAALLATLVTAGLLPRMHERYFFLADVLALAFALSSGTRASWRIAILVELGSLLGVLAFLSGIDALAVLGAAATIVATLQLAQRLLRPAANDNHLADRPLPYPSIPS